MNAVGIAAGWLVHPQRDGRFDAVAFAGTAAVMFVVALLASYIPALRASRVDPIIALRAE